MHELVHCADAGQHIAHSQEFVSFANAFISDCREKAKSLSKTELDALDDKLKSDGIWPSLYGTENLTEALAECCTGYLEGSRFRRDNVWRRVDITFSIKRCPDREYS